MELHGQAFGGSPCKALCCTGPDKVVTRLDKFGLGFRVQGSGFRVIGFRMRFA